MNADRDLIPYFESCQIHECGIEHHSLGVADFGDGLRHGVKLRLTIPGVN